MGSYIQNMAWLVTHPYPAAVRLLSPGAFHWLQTNPLHGFRGYLLSQLSQLEHEKRLRLFAFFNVNGWPVHLQTLENAYHKILPGTPWTPADDLALVVTRSTGLSFDDIAPILFEGRSGAECQARHNELVHNGYVAAVQMRYFSRSLSQSQPFPPYNDSGFKEENQPQEQQSLVQGREDVISNRSSSFNRDAPDTPTPINKEVTLQSQETQERLAKLMEGTAASELSSARSSLSNIEQSVSPAPPEMSSILHAKKTENKDISRASSSSKKATKKAPAKGSKWTQQDIEMLQNGIANGMTPAEMQRAYFPFRTVGAIDTKVSKLRRKGVNFTQGISWSAKDRKELIRLAAEGHSWEEIAANHFQGKTPDQCQEYHRCITEKLEPIAYAVEDLGKEVKHDEAEWGGDRDVEMDDNQVTDKILDPIIAHLKNEDLIDPRLSFTENAIEDELQAARNLAVDRLMPQASDEEKTQLKNALDALSWPTHLTTLEAYRTVVNRFKAKWSREDSTALQCIRQLPNPPSNKNCAQAFFPGRSADGVRTHFQTLNRKKSHSSLIVEDSNQDLDEDSSLA